VFPTTLVGGDHAGEEAEVTVTVNSVKERELPELDDDFARPRASSTPRRAARRPAHPLEQMARLEQGVQARDRALEALLAQGRRARCPRVVVQSEIESRQHALAHQLEQAT
jgi:trigger factor